MVTDEGKQGIGSKASRVLGLAGLLVAAALVQGCGGNSGGACFPGRIQTTWILTENGAPVQCAPGDEVDLIVDGLTADPAFQCSAHTGISPEVEGGVSHAVSLKLFDGNNNLLSQTGIMSLFVSCNSVTNTPQVDFSLTP
jgi:hypothetical protein